MMDNKESVEGPKRTKAEISVTRKKLPNVYKSYPKMISLEN